MITTDNNHLATAIEELTLLDTARPATFDDLMALNIARNSVEALFRACIAELSTDPKNAALWSALTAANDLSSPARGSRRHDSARSNSGPNGAQNPDGRANLLLQAFWREFAPDSTWDFVPLEFLHAPFD